MLIGTTLNDFFPVEYGLGIFSFEKDIENVRHTIISSKIPLGYRREVMEICRDSHGI